MAQLLQSTAYTRKFKMISSTDHLSLKTGASPVVNLSKGSGTTFAAAGGVITEEQNGWYHIALTTTDTNTAGDLAYYITGTGADDTDFCDQVISADLAAVKADTAAIKVQTDKLTFTVANQIDANVLDWKSATAPAMTGDAFARLGAPAGASVSVDVAGVKTDTAAIKTKTDSLTFTGAGKVDASLRDWVGDTIPARAIAGVPLVDVNATFGVQQGAFGLSYFGEAMIGAQVSTAGGFSPTTTQFEISLNDIAIPTQADFFKNSVVAWSVGAALAGNFSRVTASSKQGTLTRLTVSPAMPVAPTNTNAVVLMGLANAQVDQVNDKTGYALTASYDPAKTAAQAGDAMALTSAERNATADAMFVRAMVESYAALHAAPTLAQALFEIRSLLSDFSIAATTITTKKIDGTTTATTATLDDAIAPTSRTRAT